MKKVIIFILAISIALFIFVPFPASATEGLYVDVLDYSTLNNSGSNSGNIQTSGIFSYDFTDTYGKVRCYSFDILFSFSGNSNFSINSVNYGGHSVDFEYEIFSSGLCRLTGNCTGLQQSKLTFNITSPGTTYFTFSSIKLYTVPSNVISVPAVLTDDTGNSSTIAINSSGAVIPSIPSGVTSYSVRYSVAIPYEYWSCFDLISFSFRNHCQSLNSVSALIGVSTEAVPCDVSFIADPYSAGYVYGSVFVDVSSLIKADYSDSLFIYFNSSVGVNGGNFLVHSVNGHLFTDPVDPLTVYLQLINDNLDLIYGRSVTITNYLNNIRTYLNNTLSPYLQNVLSFYEVLDSSLSTITSRLNTIKSSVESDFDELWDRITQMTTDIRSYIQSLETSMISYFEQAIGLLLQLVDGQPVDETVVDDMQQSEDELGSMTQEMGSMTPDVSAGDVNVDFSSFTDPAASSTVNQIFISITSNETISTFILIVVSLALVGYLFFGKR